MGTVFLVSAVSKVRNTTSFADFVDSVRALSPARLPFARPVALLVVVLEIAVAASQLVPVEAVSTGGLVLAISLLTVFTIAIVSAIRRRVTARCACFGRSDKQLGGMHVFRNVLLIGVAVSGLFLRSSAGLQPGGVAVAVAGGLLAGVLVVILEDIWELFRTPI